MDRPALDGDRVQRSRPADAARAERSRARASASAPRESDPRVQAVLARFPGAKMVEVRRLAAEPPESDASGEDPPRVPTATIDSRSRGSIMADFLGMMKQAAQLQSKMQAMQDELGQSRSRASPAAVWSACA